MKTGLVLEGGGMRGSYTCGVLDAFLDHHIKFNGVIGVSAGACHGCSYVSGQRGRSFRITETYQHDPRYMGMRSGSLTVIKSKNIGKPLKYGFFFVKFLFLYVVCVVIMI